MREFTIDLHDGRGNQVYVLKIDQLAALEAVVKEKGLTYCQTHRTLGIPLPEGVLTCCKITALEKRVEILELEKGILQEQKEIMKEQIAALTAERDRLREACGYRWRKLLTETEPKEEEGK